MSILSRPCLRCGVDRPLIEYAWAVTGQTRRRTCRVCRRAQQRAHYAAHPEIHTRAYRKYVANDPEHVRVIVARASLAYRDRHRDRVNARTRESLHGRTLRRFGLTQADYEQILASQGGGCVLCHTTIPHRRRVHFDIDHDHRTGEIRGLLCNRCNMTLGRMQDDADWFRRAADYLNNGNRHMTAREGL